MSVDHYLSGGLTEARERTTIGRLILWLSWISKSNFQQIENQREKNHGLQWIENDRQKSELIGI